MFNSVGLASANNYQKSSYKRENVAFAGNDENQSDKSLVSSPIAQAASLGVGLLGIAAFLKGRFNLKNQEKFLKEAFELLGEKIPDTKRLSQRVMEMQKKLSVFASVDDLTGLYNKKVLNASLVKVIEEAKKSGGKVSIVAGDIDFFKGYNDVKGHEAGDKVLEFFGTLSKNSLNKIGEKYGKNIEITSYRNGGEEFVFIVKNADQATTKKIFKEFSQQLKSGMTEEDVSKFIDTIDCRLIDLKTQQGMAKSLLEKIDNFNSSKLLNDEAKNLKDEAITFISEKNGQNDLVKTFVNHINNLSDDTQIFNNIELAVGDSIKKTSLREEIEKLYNVNREIMELNKWKSHMLDNNGITSSFGVAESLKDADKAAYAAKNAGRNLILTAKELLNIKRASDL